MRERFSALRRSSGLEMHGMRERSGGSDFPEYRWLMMRRFELRGQVRVGLRATDLLVTMAMQTRLNPTGASLPLVAGL